MSDSMQFDLGWIIYNKDNAGLEPEEHPLWNEVRAEGANYILEAYNSYTLQEESIKKEMKKYAIALRNMAASERKREIDLLASINDNSDVNELTGLKYLKKLNEILKGEEAFDKLTNRLYDNIIKVEQKTAGSDSEEYKTRAPSIAINFPGYFLKALQDKIEVNSKELAVGDFYKNPLWDKLIDESIEVALRRCLLEFKPEKENDRFFGEVEEYKGIFELLDKNPDFRDLVWRDFQLDKIKEVVYGQFETDRRKTNKKNKNRFQISQGEVYSTEKDPTGERTIRFLGGFISEFFENSKIQINLSDKGVTNKGAKIRSNIGATDAINILSSSVKINIQVEELLQEAMDGGSQREIAYQIKRLQDKKLSRKKYKDAFVIHTSNKMYTLGTGFSGFTKMQNIEDMKRLVEYYGIGGHGARFGHMLTSLYYNTIDGAVLGDSEKRERVRDILRTVLSGVAAQALFADWTMLGAEYEGASHIHIFDLDGVLIPFSYVLEAMATGFEKYNDGNPLHLPAFAATINTAKVDGIKWPKDKNPEDRYGIEARYTKDPDYKLRFMEYFKEQRSAVQKKASKVKITFFRNFKTMIKKIREEFNNNKI